MASRVWNVYYDRLVRGNDREDFLRALPPQDHLATFEWLFPDYATSDSTRIPSRFMLAQLQEGSGAHADALANYRSLSGLLTAQGARSGGMVDDVRRAIRRLETR